MSNESTSLSNGMADAVAVNLRLDAQTVAFSNPPAAKSWVAAASTRTCVSTSGTAIRACGGTAPRCGLWSGGNTWLKN